MLCCVRPQFHRPDNSHEHGLFSCVSVYCRSLADGTPNKSKEKQLRIWCESINLISTGKESLFFSSISLSYCCCCSISLIQTTKCQCVCIVCSIQWVLLDYVCVCKKQNQTVWLCLPVNNNDWPRDRPTDRPTVWPANGNSLPNGGNHQFSGHRNACSLFRSPPEFEASAVRHCLPAPNTSIFHFMLSDKIHTISTNIEWNGEIHFVFRINNEYTIYYCKSMRLKSISADEWCAQTPALFLRIVLLLFGLPFRMRVTRRCAMCNVEG